MKSVQRTARVRMETELPRLIASARAVWDRDFGATLSLRNGRFIANSVRAAVLVLKICEGKSADAMVARYQRFIDEGIFRFVVLRIRTR